MTHLTSPVRLMKGMTMKIRAKFNTGISFWEKVTTYTVGKGVKTTWQLYTEGTMSVFPCEWRSKFMSGKNRNETYSADAEGVLERISVRMPYIPVLYEKLRSGSVIVVKGADESAIVDNEPNPNCLNVYEVFSGVDNMMDENQYMQFYLQRYEVTG